MSGGIDSSVAAVLLKQQGYDVTGVMMKLWDGREVPEAAASRSCFGPGEGENIEEARRIARMLEIPFRVLDLSAEFRKEVIDYTNREYLSGRTPNPCIRCNLKVKFEALWQKTRESGIGFDVFATGHYCRVEYSKERNRYLLKKGEDPKKDQSYFLVFLSQAQLSRTVFPVGGLRKAETREIARELGLEIAGKPESQDFIVAGYRSLIAGSKPGYIRNRLGEIIGDHPGIANFTIGQRKGLGLYSPEPSYVTDIDPVTGDITIGGRDDIYRDELTASCLNWIAFDKLEEPMRLAVKIRSTHLQAEALVSSAGPDRVRVKFTEPQMAVTPGQAAVFYLDDIVAGGGIIDR